MCNQKIKRFELVELTVPELSTGRVNFNSIPQLRNQANQTIVIKDIAVYIDTEYQRSQNNNTVVGMPTAELAKTVLVLYVNGEESIKMIPLAQLRRIQGTAGNPFQNQMQSFEDLSNVDWDKSYVQFNAASNAAIYVIPFGVTYIRMMKDPADPYGNSWVES